MSTNLKDFKYYKSLAIIGGTFDPIHNGHLAIAEAVRIEYNVDKVFFIPNGNPPHKNIEELSDGKHRYLMSVLATLSNKYFDVLDIEIENEGHSYTVDTISKIKSHCLEETPIYLIIGADALFEIYSWKDYGKLLSICNIVTVARPGYKNENLAEFVDILNNEHHASVSILELPISYISSSQVRQRVRNKQSIKYITPEPVEDYIYKYGLFHESLQFEKVDFSSINHYLKENLSKKRFKHSNGVAQMALTLAKLYGVDENKAYVAGLLHDIAKDMSPNETFKLSNEYGIKIDPIMQRHPGLIHSFLSAELSKVLFGLDDNDVLNAISYHTTGRSKMSTLEQIIFIADITEPNRETFDGLAEIRKAAFNDLDQAMVLSLKSKINNVMRKGEIIHPLSTEALAYYERITN